MTCEKRNGVVDYVGDWHRVLSPSVAMEAGLHFNCSSFGGPLESSVEVCIFIYLFNCKRLFIMFLPSFLRLPVVLKAAKRTTRNAMAYIFLTPCLLLVSHRRRISAVI